MKILVFVLTFLVVLCNSMMVVSYSCVKPYFKRDYDVSDSLLGILATCSYLGNMVGIALRYMFFGNRKKLMDYFLGSMLINNLTFASFPIISLMGLLTHQNFTYILVPLRIVTGLSGFSMLIAMQSLLHEHFDNGSQGALIAVWMTANQTGSALGYGISTLFLTVLNLRWEIVHALLPLVMAIFVTIVYLIVPMKIQGFAQEESICKSNHQITMSDFWQFIKESVSKPDFAVFTMVILTINPIFRCFRDWLPIYLFNWGKVELIAPVGAILIVTMVLGAYYMGKMYEQHQGTANELLSSSDRLYWPTFLLAFMISMGLLTICLTDSFIAWLFYLIIALLGLSIGGVLNSQLTNEVFRLAGGSGRQLDLHNTFAGLASMLAVGVTNLVISFFLHIVDRSSHTNSYVTVFQILCALSLILFVVLAIKGIYQYCCSERSQLPFLEQEADHDLQS